MISIEQLNDTLSKVGTTPIDEPELFQAIEEKTLKRSEIIAKVLERSGLTFADVAEMDPKVLSEFYAKIREHVTSVRLPDGSFKTTPNTKSFRLPNFLELEEISELMEEAIKQTDGETRDAKMLEMNDKIIQVTKMDTDKLTPWEQVLIISQVFACMSDVEQTSMGKPLGSWSTDGITTR